MKCFVCGSRLKISLSGAEFLIRDGSTEDNINFEKMKKLEGVPEKIDEDVMFDLKIECCSDPSHMIFAHTDAMIRLNVYSRIAHSAMELARKYHSEREE